MARWLWSLGALLVMLGVAAHLLGWEALLWAPQALLEAVRDAPWTFGLVVAGLALMVVARVIGHRRGWSCR